MPVWSPLTRLSLESYENDPDRIKQVQADFGDFGKESNLLSDKSAYCKALAAELEAQEEAALMIKKMKVSNSVLLTY